jgi:hypothetical protein
MRRPWAWLRVKERILWLETVKEGVFAALLAIHNTSFSFPYISSSSSTNPDRPSLTQRA